MSALADLLPIILAVLGIGLVIVVHELGHYWAARKVGVRVEAFSIGFGPRLFGWVKDGVDWKVCVIPFGGYVKMAGEDPTRPTTGKDDELGAKTVSQRILVISAGVIMNLLFALVALPIAFSFGVPFEAPVIGSVEAFSPAHRAGLQAEDRVLSVDGQRAISFTDLSQGVILSDGEVELQIERGGEPLTLGITGEDAGRGFRQIGVGASFQAFTVPEEGFLSEELPVPDASRSALNDAFEKAGLQPGDEVVAIEGVLPSQWLRRQPLGGGRLSLHGLPSRISVQRDGALRTLTLPAARLAWFDPDEDRQGMLQTLSGPGVLAEEVAGILAGDQILAIDGQPVLVRYDIEPLLGGGVMLEGLAPESEVRPTINAPTVQFQLLREGRLVEHSVELPTLENRRDFLRQLRFSEASLRLSPVVGGALESAGVRLGDALVSIGSEPLEEGYASVREATKGKEPGTVLKLEVVRPGDGEVVLGQLPPTALLPGDRILGSDEAPGANAGRLITTLADLPEEITEAEGLRVQRSGERLSFEVTLAEQSINQAAMIPISAQVSREAQQVPFLESFGVGFRQALKMIRNIFGTLGSVVTGEVSSKNLGGIISIFTVSKASHSVSLTYGLFFLALISINLAVVNILPIPMLDGGWLVFLLIERITGRPPSDTIVGIANWIGFVFIILLMLYVTWNDIQRLLGWI